MTTDNLAMVLQAAIAQYYIIHTCCEKYSKIYSEPQEVLVLYSYHHVPFLMAYFTCVIFLTDKVCHKKGYNGMPT